jgi:FkbM family methyltransferase
MSPSAFQPGWLLRLFRASSFRHKLGCGELLWRRSLRELGVSWVEFGDLKWKLNLENSTHRWLVYGEYEEPGVRRLLARVLNRDSVIVDSGANIGQMVLMYLNCGALSMIHAFEPTPEARDWLAGCVAINALSNVNVSSLALGDNVGKAQLTNHAFSQKEGAQNRIITGDGGISIGVTTLDTYSREASIKNIRFWKLDTEGHELPALKGATLLLQRGAIDYLYVETADAGGTIAEFLGKLGYIATNLALDRRLTTSEVGAKFTNVFVSARVAREECGLTRGN